VVSCVIFIDKVDKDLLKLQFISSEPSGHSIVLSHCHSLLMHFPLVTHWNWSEVQLGLAKKRKRTYFKWL